jgi:hypothetical protein
MQTDRLTDVVGTDTKYRIVGKVMSVWLCGSLPQPILNFELSNIVHISFFYFGVSLAVQVMALFATSAYFWLLLRFLCLVVFGKCMVDHPNLFQTKMVPTIWFV